MAKKISLSEVEKIATLARLDLTDEEKETAARELTGVLTYVERLSDVDTKDVMPFGPEPEKLADLRNDEEKVFGGRKELLSHETFEDSLLSTKGVFSDNDHDTR